MMEERFDFQVEEEAAGQRLDSLLNSLLEDCSRSYLQKLIGAGNVSVNGQAVKEKNLRLKIGQQVSVLLPEAKELSVEPEDIPLSIVYEDEDLLVVDKPKGMVVHPAPGSSSGTLVNGLLHHCGDRLSGINGVIRPGIVHRIDKDTGGLLVVAKNDAAHKGLASQLESHSMTRAYEAIVYNSFTEDSGTVDAPLGRDPRNRLRQWVVPDGRRAVTHWTVLERLGRFNYLEARLETGRTHQIRVHMAYIKHPLVGDPVYGPKKGLSGIDGQCLHAKTLGFIHPRTEEYMEFSSPLPAEFTAVLERLRKMK